MENSSNKKNSKIINCKDLLMISLSKFYSQKNNINKILSIIDPPVSSTENISLRLIDWFVTNYSKKYNIIIEKTQLNVYLSYRSQLKAYSKQLFDPFRRRDRITFYFDSGKSIETTIGQLNMFRWIIENNILDYIYANINKIETDMIYTQKNNMIKKHNDDNIKIRAIQTDNGIIYQKRKKRNQLSKNSIKNMNLLSGQRVITFD